MNYSKYHMVLQACRTSSRVILQTTNTALNGALDHDLNRDIDMIIYDQLGNLQDICFYDHSTTEYIYAADGTKLRTIHHPASSSSLTDSIDYIGNLILKNDKPLMYLFGGGYATFDTKTKNEIKNEKAKSSFGDIVAQHNGSLSPK